VGVDRADPTYEPVTWRGSIARGGAEVWRAEVRTAIVRPLGISSPIRGGSEPSSRVDRREKWAMHDAAEGVVDESLDRAQEIISHWVFERHPLRKRT